MYLLYARRGFQAFLRTCEWLAKACERRTSTLCKVCSRRSAEGGPYGRSLEAKAWLELAKQKQYRVLGELSLELQGRPLTPDLSVYLRKPADFRHDTIRVTQPPLVVVEICSPTQGYQDVLDKVDAYLNSGVKTCWGVNPPQHAVTIYSADGSQKTYVEGQAVDPATGLTANLEAVFS